MSRLRLISSAILLALMVTAAVLPLAAARAAGKGCHCPVKMACCKDGTCPMAGHEPPADGPEWRTCRREAVGTASAPLDPFERALMNSGEAAPRRPVGEAAAVHSDRPRSTTPGPATLPPRSLSF